MQVCFYGCKGFGAASEESNSHVSMGGVREDAGYSCSLVSVSIVTKTEGLQQNKKVSRLSGKLTVFGPAPIIIASPVGGIVRLLNDGFVWEMRCQ